LVADRSCVRKEERKKEKKEAKLQQEGDSIINDLTIAKDALCVVIPSGQKIVTELLNARKKKEKMALDLMSAVPYWQ
jgi:hypothetical protein